MKLLRVRVHVRLAWLAAGVAALLAACAGGGPGPSGDPNDVRTLVGPGVRGYPFAASRTTTRTWFGEPVSDDFEWLENAADPYTRSWTAAETAYGRRHLDAMPARAALRERVQALLVSTISDYGALAERGNLVFALKSGAPSQRAVLVALRSIDDTATERVVFDPNDPAADAAGGIAFFRPSPDGRRVAIAVRGTGGAPGALRVVDVATGQSLADRVAQPRDAAWSANGAGLFYTRAVPLEQVLFHRLGATAALDRLDLGTGLPRQARIVLASTRDGRSLAALAVDATSGDTVLFLKTADANGEGSWRRLAAEVDGVRQVQFGDDDALYVLSVAGAPRGRVLRLGLAEARGGGLDKATTLVAPTDAVIQHLAVAGGTLVLAELAGSTPRLRTLDVKTRRTATQALPAGAGVSALARTGRSEVVAQVSTPLAPPGWTHVGGRARRTALLATSDAAFNDCEVSHEFASSRDGTQVPLTLLRRRGLRADGRNPVLLAPGDADAALAFDPARRAWLDRGGVVAIAHVRGVEGFGEDWRRDGSASRASNAVDDFLAAARALVQRGVTQPALLGASGRDAGALVVAAAVARQPELFHAASVAGGSYDLLLAARGPAGVPDLPAQGAFADRAQFDAARAVSPMQGVRDGVNYPAVLVTLSDAPAAHARKWLARLQQADPSGRPLLLRTGESSGQDGPASLPERVEQASDELGFFLNELLSAQ